MCLSDVGQFPEVPQYFLLLVFEAHSAISFLLVQHIYALQSPPIKTEHTTILLVFPHLDTSAINSFSVNGREALKTQKIMWPNDWGKDIWIITVDGTHCWINEPRHQIGFEA